MIAYLDMPSGISGDIFLGCLVDAGWPLEKLRATIERLGLPPESWSLEQERVMRGPLAATLLKVEAAEGDQHRHLHHIAAILNQADLPQEVKSRSLAVFQRLAEAEAAVHGSNVEEVHFHEVGALDAIIDVVGVCAGLDALGIQELYASAAPLGEGWTNSAHGRIPLPAPATLAILSGVGAPTRPAPGPGELVTPTGAALIAELATFRQPPMRLQRIGLGAGRKEFAWPNVARLWLGQADSMHGVEGQIEAMVLLETNIDDMNPELYAGVSRALFAVGARDVWLAPIQMKKDRPAVQLSVLAPATEEVALVTTLLRETTTLGVRVQPVTRYAAARTMETVTTQFGEVAVKVKWIDGEAVGAKPEHEECARLAQAHGVPVRVVYEAAAAAAYTTLLAAVSLKSP
jgi:pyridinium-3,5-bisthiocarboxylic acid mononucleotide nickel chelatase